MSRRSGGLGRGIGALIPQDVLRSSGSELRDLPVNDIEPSRYQPRDQFDEDSLVALSESIRVVGVLQPVLVRPLDDQRFELIAGERRWRAARRAGLSTIPAIVRATEERASLEQALVENLHRQDLSALEEAAAYLQLIEDFGLTQEAVAERVGKSRSAVANTLRLIQLPPTIQGLLRSRRFSAGHARALLASPDRAFQEAMAQRICDEGLSVRQVEEAIRRRAELEARLEGAGTDPAEDGSFDSTARSSPGGLGSFDDAPSRLGSSGQVADGPDAAPPAPLRVGTDEDHHRNRHRNQDDRGAGAGHSSLAVPPAGLLELEQLLEDFLDTPVQVTMARGRGRISIAFATVEDLERIYRLMAGPAGTT